MKLKYSLGYKDKKTIAPIIKELLLSEKVRMTIPDKPHSRNQKDITEK